MKRVLCMVLATLLVAMLLVPAVAVAKSDKANTGGTSQAYGQTKKSDDDAKKPGKKDADSLQDEDEASDDAESDGAGVGNGKALGKTKEYHVRSRVASGAPDSDDASSSVEPKHTGIANALDRVMANLERAEAKGHVPNGLVRVVDKFLSWLGLAPELVEPAPDGEASEESTATPDPESGEDTSTVAPVEGEEGGTAP